MPFTGKPCDLYSEVCAEACEKCGVEIKVTIRQLLNQPDSGGGSPSVCVRVCVCVRAPQSLVTLTSIEVVSKSF